MSILADIQTLEPGARIELYELDASGIGADQLYFHAHLQSGPIYWQGQQYDPWPIKATGFEKNSDQAPRPQLQVGNVGGVIGALCIMYDDLVGARLIRRRTLKQYLDAANFPEGNPTADPDEHFPDETWRIEQKSGETKEQVTFVLSGALDFDDQQLPDRQIVANHCAWLKRGGYRGPYCGYAGTACFDIRDNPVEDPAQDRCGGRLTSCQLRFGENNPLPFGSFPSAGRLRS